MIHGRVKKGWICRLPICHTGPCPLYPTGLTRVYWWARFALEDSPHGLTLARWQRKLGRYAQRIGARRR